MNIIIGHSNMDIDCIASVVLARRLYPDHTPVRSNRFHPVAKNLYNLYETDLNFLAPGDLDGEEIESLVIVDTRSRARVREYLKSLKLADVSSIPEVLVYDHHPASADDLEGMQLHHREVGANATNLGLEIMDRRIVLSAGEATIALAGIYADTGNYTHENTTPEDFHVASYLLSCGASIPVVISLIRTLRTDEQIGLVHEALHAMTWSTLKGHDVASFELSLAQQTPGLASVVEKVFELENVDAVFGVFEFVESNRCLIIARSSDPRVNVQRILASFQGGGHEMAASATVKGVGAGETMAALRSYAEELVHPALTAESIMTREVCTIASHWSLLEASKFLEGINHTGAPVLDEAGVLVGFLTLRDIMKGRKSDMMHAPVKAYMSRNVITAPAEATMHDMERSFFEYNIGHLPIVDDGSLVGIVTRSDYLEQL